MSKKKALSFLLSFLISVSSLSVPASAEAIRKGDTVEKSESVWQESLNKPIDVGSFFGEGKTELQETAKPQGKSEKELEQKLSVQKSAAPVPTASKETYGDFEYTYDEAKDEITITAYNGSGVNVVIPEQINGIDVTGIDSYTFQDKYKLETVAFPSGLKTLGSYVFQNCVRLKNAELPDTVESIGSGAFYGCKKLESFHYPKKLNNCGNGWSDDGLVFSDCELLKTISVPEGVTKIPDYAFRESNCLESIVLPSTLTTIGYSAFQDCSLISEITLPDSVTTIEGRAFAGCTALKTVKWSKNLTAIEGYAFESCVNLTSAELPDTVESIGSGAFYGCKKLESFHYPKKLNNCGNGWSDDGFVFSDCELLKTISVPEGVTKIPGYTFKGANCLESIVLPLTLTTIGYSAFENCNLISEITLPDSVTTIEGRAFAGCTALKTVKWSKSLTNIEGYAFESCVNLTSAELPDTVERLCSGAFSGCKKLESFHYPKKLNYFGDDGYLFYDCELLKTISVPEGVTKIPDYAFRGSNCLENLILPSSITEFGWNCVDECPKLTVYCPKYNISTIGIIDSKVNVISTDDKRTVRPGLINANESHFTIKSGIKLNAECTYCVRNTVYDKASDMSITIYIPDNSIVIPETVYLDKKLTDYDIDENHITIPVTKSKGKITFNLEMDESCNFCTYAVIDYFLNGEQGRDIIDVISEKFDFITISSDEFTDSSTFTAYGIAPAGHSIDISVNDNAVTTVKANKAGMYTAQISLDNPVEGEYYKIKAESTDSTGTYIYAVTNIRYNPSAPVLTELYMDYNGLSYDLMAGMKYNVSFAIGSTPFKFRAKYKNIQSIDTVYITSTRNMVKKKMEAVYDESTGFYVAEGFFDENDEFYIPGTIGVEFREKTDASYSFDMIENEYSEAFIPEVLRNATNELVIDEENRKQIVITLPEGEKITYTYEQIPVAEFEAQLDSGDGKTPAQSGASAKAPSGFDIFSFAKKLIDRGWDLHEADLVESYTYIDENGEENTTTYFNYNNANEYVEKEIIDWEKENLKELLLKDVEISEVMPHTKWALNYAKDGYTEVINCMGDTINYQTAQIEIMSSNLSEAQKQEELARLHELRSKAIERTCVKMVGSYLKMVGGYMMAGCPPLGLAIYITGFWMSDLYGKESGWFKEVSNKYTSFLKNTFWFNLDPSGFIYEAVTSNRISGAEATAYWIPYDEEDDTFWNSPQVKNAVKWDSEQYSQDNPLISDDDGNYAWDVPEGWWQVVVEKEGYETYTTEWLPVPPPQTDVNIGLRSTKATTVEKVDSTEKTIGIAFDMYIDPSTASNIVITDNEGNSVPYKLEYPQNETSDDGTVYSKSFTLVLKRIRAELNISVPETVTTYCGVPVNRYEEKIKFLDSDTDTDPNPDITLDSDTEDYDSEADDGSIYIYFDNSSYNWDNVYAYIYDEVAGTSNGDWPGFKMTEKNSKDYFVMCVDDYAENGRVLFNDGTGSDINRYPGDGEPGMLIENKSKLFSENHTWSDYKGPVHVDSETDTSTDSDTESETDIITDTDTDTEAETDTTTDTDTESDTDTTTDSDTDTDTDSATDTTKDSDTDTESETDTTTDSDTESETDITTDSDTNTESETDTTTDSDTDPQTDTTTDSETDTDDTYTYYFLAPYDWFDTTRGAYNEDVGAYYWYDDDNTPVAWPGVKMVSCPDIGKNVFKIEGVPADMAYIIFNAYFNVGRNSTPEEIAYAHQTDNLSLGGYKKGECPYDSELTTENFNGWICVCNCNDLHDNAVNVCYNTGSAWFTLDDYKKYSDYYGTYDIGDDQPIGVLGDIDSDGEITANDALTILRSSVGMANLTPEQNKLADVDGDTEITANDALAVLRYSVGMAEDDSPINKPIMA